MRHWGLWIVILLTVIIPFSGCTLHEKVLPAHTEVLIFDLSYDLVYLRTLEALDYPPDWQLYETEKEKGIIKVHNVAYQKFPDPDQRIVTVLVKRMDRSKTSVELAPQSQRILGAGNLMKRVSEYVGREL